MLRISRVIWTRMLACLSQQKHEAGLASHPRAYIFRFVPPV